jgi:pyruvate-ferredoxin/flavodoxin oxidoreductase
MQSEGGRGGGGARRAPGRRPDDDLHGVAGAAADDPQHVQDRRRADPGGLPCRRPLAGHARPLDLRRPPGRDGRARHRLRPAGLGSVQEAHDLAAIAQMATLESRIPFLHFFDGFRTSHEINRIELLSDDDLRALVDEGSSSRTGTGAQPRPSRSSGARPRTRTSTSRCARRRQPRSTRRSPDVVAAAMGGSGAHRSPLRPVRLPRRAGRRARRGPDGLRRRRRTRDGGPPGARGERVGCCRCGSTAPSRASTSWPRCPPRCGASPCSTGPRSRAPGEPLYLDVVAALAEGGTGDRSMPRVVGGRYGLSSKEFTPAMAKAVLDELSNAELPRTHFTVGIHDDVSHSSPGGIRVLRDRAGRRLPGGVLRAGRRRHGRAPTRTPSRSSARTRTSTPGLLRLRLEEVRVADRLAPALRAAPIRSAYLVRSGAVRRLPPVPVHRDGSTCWAPRPGRPPAEQPVRPRRGVGSPAAPVQDTIVAGARLWVIDAAAVAREAGSGGAPTASCRRASSPSRRAAARGGAGADQAGPSGRRTGRRATRWCSRTSRRWTGRWSGSTEVEVPERDLGTRLPLPVVPPARRLRPGGDGGDAGRAGDSLPVSAFPVDGTSRAGPPGGRSATSRTTVAAWDPGALHPVRQLRVRVPARRDPGQGLPGRTLAARLSPSPRRPSTLKGFPDTRYTLQVYEEDCTGCALCVEACPVKDLASRSGEGHQPGRGETPRSWSGTGERALLRVAPLDRPGPRGLLHRPRHAVPRAALRVLGRVRRLRRDAVPQAPLAALRRPAWLVANATGCSSIYGGNLPTTPWAANAEGRGPAWSNSLFEDNAEFGLGMRLAADQLREARRLLGRWPRPPSARRWPDALLDRAAAERDARSGAARAAWRR